MATIQPAPPSSRLRRSTHDRVIFGVCTGLGAYFQVDPVLVRIAFVLATLAGGAGIPLYVVLAIVIPSESDAEPIQPTSTYRTGFARQRSAELLGGFLAVVGLYLLAGNLGWMPWLNEGVLWSAFLIAMGVYLLALHGSRRANLPRS